MRRRAVHRVVTAGTSQSFTPAWNGTPQGTTVDGTVVWQNVGHGANWMIPFGLAVEPAPTASDPLRHNILVPDEGYSMVFRLDASGNFLAVPLAMNISFVTQRQRHHLHAASPSSGGPTRFNGNPTGTLPAGTTQATMGLATSVAATCRYGSQPGVPYGSMTHTFTTTGSTAHTTLVSGLTGGHSYQFYVRCVDGAGNANVDDYVIAFFVASASATTSTFAATESPLSEGGRWDSPGAWADLRTSNGAFAVGLNALGRLATPAVGADQYSEITYDQDPGTASWVGVATRIQGASNGSGYLAIAYAGEVRLYRADDNGSLSFTLLASASAAIGNAPRRLRLESEGNVHRVYFNGTQMIVHAASGTIYASGQPGIAASVFGGPQVKILSFEGGSLGGAPVDSTPPLRFNGQPAGTLAAGTTQATLGLTTGEGATCRYSSQAGVAYASMLNTFTTTGSTTHATVVSGLTGGHSYQFNVRCVDAAGNANTDDYVIAFSVAGASATTSTFAGTENPLLEGGRWDSPGAWADLRKSDGAFAVGLNAQATAGDAGGGGRSVRGDHVRPEPRRLELGGRRDTHPGGRQRKRLPGHRLCGRGAPVPDRRYGQPELHAARLGDAPPSATAPRRLRLESAGQHPPGLLQRSAGDHPQRHRDGLRERSARRRRLRLRRTAGEDSLVRGWSTLTGRAAALSTPAPAPSWPARG